LFTSGQAFDASTIPAELLPRVGPDAPAKAKLMVAKALLPMPPDQLGVALAVLARDPDETIAEAAQASLKDLPRNVIESLAGGDSPGLVLDVFAHVLSDDVDLLRILIRNEATADETVRWMARSLRGDVLPIIAANQRRLIREPQIIAALVANAATPTPTLAPVIETALRNDVDTSRIPGFKQLAEAFFGDLSRLQGDKAVEPAPVEDEPQAPASPVDEAPSLTLELAPDAQGGADEAHLETLLRMSAAAPEDEDEDRLLRRVDHDEPEDGEEEDERKKSLWGMINDMNVPQKVRLALMGDASARAILIRDSKKTVAMATIRSPRMTLKEVAGFAQNKAIAEDVIREIARNREWTKNYAVRLALVKNPKCPTTQAVNFLAGLRNQDIRNLARARNVPAYVARAAKNILTRRKS